MKKSFLALILASVVAMSLSAQFTAETRLVIVNLSAKDRSGKPILTLKKEDVEVFEDGVRQEIKVFELQKLDGEALPSLAETSPSKSKTIEEKAAKPKPEVKAYVEPAKNSVIKYQDRRLLCLLFDMTSMQPPEQLRAQEAAIKFLETQMTTNDLVEIMTFNSNIKVVEEFTADRERLITSLKKLTVGQGSDFADLATTAADEGDDSGSFTADDTEFNIFNTDRKLSALEDASRKLGAFPEKKALIYFSSGVGKTGVENQSQIKATTNAAVRANVSIYSIDARGLVATPPGGDASQASSRGTGMITGTKQAGLKATFQNTQETLTTISEDTGGKAMLDTNDLTMGIQQAQDDINSYYIVGYNPKNSADDGKLRRIEVKLVNKTMSAKLDFRKAYYANKQFKNFNSTDKERQLEEALTLGDPVSELPLALEVDYFRVAKDRYSFPISVKIPGSAVGLQKKGAKQVADFDFIGQVRDAQNKLVTGVRDNITVKLGEGDAAAIGRRNIQYDTVPLPLPPGTYSLRFLARENQSGKMGTFETKFTIPDLNSEKTLRLSSVIWSNQREAVSSTVGSADNNKKLLAAHPLVQDGQKILPSITKVFRKDQTMYVFFEVYDPAMDPDRKVPSLTAEVELISGGRRVFTSAPVRQNKLADKRPGVAQFSFQIPLAKIAAGQYISQVNVIDETGHKFAFPRNEIVLLAADTKTQASAEPKPLK
ncbi:MAG TPA: VWA domain-containing protein [Bryobacteraceae bacterium]|jgi:VWFA-related protein|nr:VWA domain-containing protein [Bryobacteraceae bacterium]